MDKRIIDAAIAGDSVAFEQIYKATFPRAHSIAISIVKDDFEAYDIVQEAYIIMLQKLHTLEDPNALTAWFSRIVRNTAIDFVRKNRPALFADLEDSDEDAVPMAETISSEYCEFDPEAAAEAAELKDIMLKLIDSLPKKQRTCVLLRWQEDLKISQIAQVTGLTESTVKSCLRYGHEKLAQKVKDLEKKGFKLRSLTPIMLIPFLRWALGGKGLATSAQAAAAGTSAAVGIAGTVAAGSVAASASASAVATGAASSIAVKLVAGITAAALVTGGGIYAGAKLLAPKEADTPPAISQEKEPDPQEQTQDLPTQDQAQTPAPDPVVTPVYATFFGTTAVLSSQPITEFEGQAPDAPSGFLGEGFLSTYPDRFWHITRVVILDKLVPESTQTWFDTLGNLQTIEGLENIDTSLVTSMARMFQNCESLECITGIASWDVSNVTTMEAMFQGCTSLVFLDDLSKWDTSSLEYAHYLFFLCENLTQVTGLGSWNTTKIGWAQCLFEDCVSLVSVGNMDNWSANEHMWKDRMFANTGLQELPLWYIEYEFFNESPSDHYFPQDERCCSPEAIARIRQKYPDMDLTPYL